MKLQDRLALLEEILSPEQAGDVVGAAQEAHTALETAQREVQRAKTDLSKAIAKICGGMALAIRMTRPGLNIRLEKDSCTIGYYARAITISPDIIHGQWRITSLVAKLVTNFMRRKPPLELSSDFTPLAQSVAEFFTNFYRSLGENIEGTGQILVEGRQGTFSDLAAVSRN